MICAVGFPLMSETMWIFSEIPPKIQNYLNEGFCCRIRFMLPVHNYRPYSDPDATLQIINRRVMVNPVALLC